MFPKLIEPGFIIDFWASKPDNHAKPDVSWAYSTRDAAYRQDGTAVTLIDYGTHGTVMSVEPLDESQNCIDFIMLVSLYRPENQRVWINTLDCGSWKARSP